MESNEIKVTGKLRKSSIVLFAVAAFLLLLQAIFYGLKAVHSADFHLYMRTLCTIGAIVSTIILCFKKFGGFYGVFSFTMSFFIGFLFEPQPFFIELLLATIGYIIPLTCIIIGLILKTDNTSTFKYVLTNITEKSPNTIKYYAVFLVLYVCFLTVFSVLPKCGLSPIGNIRVDVPMWIIKMQLAWNGFEEDSELYYTRDKTTIHNQSMNEIRAIGIAEKNTYTSVVFFMNKSNNAAYERIKNDLVNAYGDYYADADLEKDEIIEVWSVKNKRGGNKAQIELHSVRTTWGWVPKSLLDCSVTHLYIRVAIWN